jgi:hypothetical protein
MIAKGELIPLSRGHYALNSPYPNPYLPYHIANTIYGVSYVSRYTALDYFSLIDDKVYIYESMTMKRSREFNNDKGLFTYHTLKEEVFSIGIKSIIGNEYTTFLMAKPEKALCDILWTTPRLDITSYKELLLFLEYDLRFDMDYFLKADLSIFEECLKFGHKKNLIRYLIKLSNNYARRLA